MRTKLEIPAYFVGSLLAALWLSGCASVPKEVANVARQDLACPGVGVAQIDTDRYGASGCGRGAVYVRVCDSSGCHWGRLRHGHEAAIGAAASSAGSETSAPREIIAAPPPEAREVIPAPAPAAREVIPAPPPGSSNVTPAPGAPAPAAGDAGVTPPASDAEKPSAVPLSQGDLSAPYDAKVPERPTAQQTAYPPPQPLVDDRPPPPASSYQWVNGYWYWSTGGWVWLPGYWSTPVVGYSYQPGYWYWSMNYWWYWPGGWCRPGSTTIVYQTAPRAQHIARVRSFTPRGGYAGGYATGYGSRGAGAPNIARAAPRGTFRPSSSPLLHYPTANVGRARSRAVAGGGIGHVVRPGSVSPRPSHFSSPRPYAGATSPARSGSFYRGGSYGGSRGSYGGGARFSPPARSAPPMRSGPSSHPSVGRAHRR